MLTNERISKSALGVLKKLISEGFQAYLVGGAVRDILLEIKPKDHDICTNATPEQLKQLFGHRAKVIGQRFRLVHVYTQDEIIEVSTFRRKPTLKERKGRKSDSGLIVWRDNFYGTLKEDATRRDFTVNAIYYNPYDDRKGLVDYVGGVEDLNLGMVRSIGKPTTRIAEDPVRMLRACKLMGQYDFRLEGNLRKEIVKNAPNLQLSSRARLLEELFKILKKPFTFPTFDACYKTGLLHYMLPTLAREWNGIPGITCQKLLRIRDEQLKRREIFPSRISGLALLILPFLTHENGKDKFGQLMDKDFYFWTKKFLSPYMVPRYIISKIYNVIGMQSKLFSDSENKALQLHPDYFRALDTFRVYRGEFDRSGVKVLGRRVQVI